MRRREAFLKRRYCLLCWLGGMVRWGIKVFFIFWFQDKLKTSRYTHIYITNLSEQFSCGLIISDKLGTRATNQSHSLGWFILIYTKNRPKHFTNTWVHFMRKILIFYVNLISLGLFDAKWFPLYNWRGIHFFVKLMKNLTVKLKNFLSQKRSSLPNILPSGSSKSFT